jgi:hypothetical protein
VVSATDPNGCIDDFLDRLIIIRRIVISIMTRLYFRNFRTLFERICYLVSNMEASVHTWCAGKVL